MVIKNPSNATGQLDRRGFSYDENEMTTTYKRNLFASSKRRNRCITTEYRTPTERHYYNSSKNSQESNPYSQVNPKRIGFESIRDRNLLNVNWIPFTVKKRLLSLHNRSRHNLSKSESNIKSSSDREQKPLRLQNSDEQ